METTEWERDMDLRLRATLIDNARQAADTARRLRLAGWSLASLVIAREDIAMHRTWAQQVKV